MKLTHPTQYDLRDRTETVTDGGRQEGGRNEEFVDPDSKQFEQEVSEGYGGKGAGEPDSGAKPSSAENDEDESGTYQEGAGLPDQLSGGQSAEEQTGEGGD
jgi:hypothetical protein